MKSFLIEQRGQATLETFVVLPTFIFITVFLFLLLQLILVRSKVELSLHEYLVCEISLNNFQYPLDCRQRINEEINGIIGHPILMNFSSKTFSDYITGQFDLNFRLPILGGINFTQHFSRSIGLPLNTSGTQIL